MASTQLDQKELDSQKVSEEQLKQTNEGSLFDQIPDDIVLEMLGWVSSRIADLAIASRISARFYRLSNGETLWRRICGIWNIQQTGKKNWKQSYRAAIEEQKTAEQEAAKRCLEDKKYRRPTIGKIKRGDFVLLKGHPCKAVEIQVSKPGKHGSSKCHLVGIDVFDNKKYEDIIPGRNFHELVPLPVDKKEYTVVDHKDDRCVVLMDDGQTREIPVAESIKDSFRDEMSHFLAQANNTDEIIVTVLSCCDLEYVTNFKRTN